MLPQLSKGAVAKLASDDPDSLAQEKPILQILDLKPLQGNMVDCYRVALSDGVNSVSNSMLSSQLVPLVKSGELSTNAIVRLDRFRNPTQQGKRILLLLELSVLKKASEVRRRIGSPQMLRVNTVASNAQPQTESNSVPSNSKVPRVETASRQGGGASTVNKPSSTASTSASASPSSSRWNSPRKNESVHSKQLQTIPIAQLSPVVTKWTILARVTSKTDIRPWSNTRGTGKLFSCVFADKSGEIRATAFNNEVDTFYEQLVEGKLFHVSRGSLKPADKRYTSTAHAFEITFNNQTQILAVDESTVEADTLPYTVMQFNWCKLSELHSHAVNTLVDVIGVVHTYQPVHQLVSKASGQPVNKRELQLVDDSNLSVCVTLWNQEAIQFEQSAKSHQAHPVLAIKSARVTEFLNRLQLGTLSSSKLFFDPTNVDRVLTLRRWYSQLDASATFTPATVTSNSKVEITELTPENVRNENTCWRTLRQVTANSGDLFFFNKSVVQNVLKKDCVYRACTAHNCHKKLVELSGGRFRCDKCDKTTNEYKYKYLVNAQIADATGSAYVVFFDDAAQSLIGCSAEQLLDLRQRNADAYDQLFLKLHGTEFIFKLRAKMEGYQDEQRLRLACVDVMPMSETDYLVHMLNDIKRWKKK